MMKLISGSSAWLVCGAFSVTYIATLMLTTAHLPSITDLLCVRDSLIACGWSHASRTESIQCFSCWHSWRCSYFCVCLTRNEAHAIVVCMATARPTASGTVPIYNLHKNRL